MSITIKCNAAHGATLLQCIIKPFWTKKINKKLNNIIFFKVCKTFLVNTISFLYFKCYKIAVMHRDVNEAH